MQVALQTLIMLTGNYTFFNVLTIALCALQLGGGVRPEVAGADYGDEGNRGKEHWDNRGPLISLYDAVEAVNCAISHSAWLQAVCVAFVACFTGVTAAFMFQVDAQTGLVLKLSNVQLTEFLVSGLPWIVAIGAGGFGVQLAVSVAPGGPARLRASSSRFGKAGKACKTLSRAVCLSLATLVGLLWLTLTCGNLFSLAPPLHATLPAGTLPCVIGKLRMSQLYMISAPFANERAPCASFQWIRPLSPHDRRRPNSLHRAVRVQGSQRNHNALT